jgi:hypothetical protein
MLIADLRHFLDMPVDVPAPARRLAAQLSAIVRVASARPEGSGGRSAVGCMKRPGRRPCGGWIMVFRHCGGEIAWGCDMCGDEGRIRGWENSPADLTAFDRSYADGETVSVLISRDLADLLRDVLLMDYASELLVARAEGRADGVVLTGTTEAFEELAEYVAAESNAETNRKRQRQLDEVCTLLETALAEE